MSSDEERKTIDRALTGDQTAFRKLYESNRDRIAATVAQRTHDADDVEDIVQLSFIRAFNSLGKFRCDSAFSTWLTRIALNVCITHHQRQRLMLPESAIEGAQVAAKLTPASPEDILAAKQRSEILLAKILALPPHYRKVMLMHYIEDRPYPELVERLAIPVGTLKTWLFRGRQMIRQAFDETDSPNA